MRKILTSPLWVPMLLFAWGLSLTGYLIALIAEQLLPMAIWLAGDGNDTDGAGT
jgi:hypothetical protein